MAELKARIGLDSSAFAAGIKRVSGLAGGLARGFVGVGARMAAVLGPVIGAAGFAGMAAGLKSALDEGGRLSDMAAQTGATARELSILGEAFRQAGGDAGSVGVVLNRLQKAI